MAGFLYERGNVVSPVRPYGVPRRDVVIVVNVPPSVAAAAAIASATFILSNFDVATAVAAAST